MSLEKFFCTALCTGVSILNPQSSILNPQSSLLNPHSSILNPQPPKWVKRPTSTQNIPAGFFEDFENQPTLFQLYRFYDKKFYKMFVKSIDFTPKYFTKMSVKSIDFEKFLIFSRFL